MKITTRVLLVVATSVEVDVDEDSLLAEIRLLSDITVSPFSHSQIPPGEQAKDIYDRAIPQVHAAVLKKVGEEAASRLTETSPPLKVSKETTGGGLLQ